ncbi:hypothetical protein ACQ4PT_012277 [Festuca glaucescens]
MVDKFRGRKSYPSQNVLAVVDFDLRFTYVLAGWEGSTHDSLVLKDALTRPAGLKIPEGKFFLADAGYAARPGILPPYRGMRYHLNEFVGSRDPTTPQELFNHRHSSFRTTVERAFAALKSRFKILTQRPFIPLKSQIKVVVACCALHNWILENGPDKYVVDEAMWYDNLPRSSGRVRDREADIREWATKRDLLAQQMWEDKESAQNTNLQIMGKHKLDVKSEEDCNSDGKYITWTDEATKFMLDWYIDLHRDKPATFKFKKQHHLQCADALNGKFSLGATQNQVDRHYRSYKEKWSWKTTINYLTRPIRFFHELEELFSDQSQADGSLAIDQTTVNVDDGNDDNKDVLEHGGYPIPVDSDEADSDIIGRLSPKVELDGNPLNKKRKRVTSSPSKNPTKGKANNKDKVSNDDIGS